MRERNDACFGCGHFRKAHPRDRLRDKCMVLGCDCPNFIEPVPTKATFQETVVAPEESRRPIILIKDRPMEDAEGQAIANSIRSVTSYPVIVMDSRWTVFP